MEESSTALVPNVVREIVFYEDMLLVALVGEIPYVALRPIAEFLGLDWSSQRRRVQRDEVLAEEAKLVLMRGADGKQHEMFSLPLEFLPGWLFGITSSKAARPEFVPKIKRYRRECFHVLWRAFQTELMGGPPAQNNTNTLTQVRNLGLAIAELAEQQIEIQAQVTTVNSRVDKAAIVVRDLQQRLSAVERRVEPASCISDTQATEISNKVKALAELLTRKDASKNHYQSIFAELYRRFEVSSYKLVRQDQYQQVLLFLDEWRKTLQ